MLLLASVFASFGAALAAATRAFSAIPLAFLAAIPGVAIIIDRTFLLADRWRWHQTLDTQRQALERRLRFEGAGVEKISRAMTDALKMEAKYPARSQGAATRSLRQ